ncbi:MAG TPA: hypothetical protein VMS31_21575 [Pyrinomonadaceae bacterium]|nr:hypothetical protein [Pyrinomonadaceae bacterium]
MTAQPTKPLLALLIVALFSSAGWGDAVSYAQTTDPIQSVRQQYAAINKRMARYKKVRKELSGYSAEGGELIAFFDGPAIVKISATYYGETGRAAEEYYYQDGTLIFVYRKDSTYSRPLSGKVIRTRENRFYFQNGRMIKWVDENGNTMANGEDYLKQQEDNLTNSNKFLSGARAKNSTIEAPE